MAESPNPSRLASKWAGWYSGTSLGAIVVAAKRQPDGSVFLFKLGGGIEILPKPSGRDGHG